MINKTTKNGRAVIRRNALAVALAIGLGLSGGVALAQSTTGTIFGNAAPSQTVQVVGDSGQVRTVTVGANGAYNLRDLPVGTYTVRLMEGDSVVTTRTVVVTPSAGTQVNFGTAGAQELDVIQVSASALPTIDVSTVSTSTVLTAQQLQQLPIAHSAESIALLSPGSVAASGYFKSSVSFGGAGVTENAYYVNGFNTTDLYDYTGATFQLPYGAIAQQQTYTGGYDAKYGRSDGGVINQVGKRGTNEWHFGGQVRWIPRALRSDPKNIYYGNPEVPAGYDLANPDLPGTMYRYRNQNKTWNTEVAAYVGGPLIEDKLFMYIAGEQDRSSTRNTYAWSSFETDYTKDRTNTYYAKLDWNINDDNVFEYTRMSTESTTGYGTAWDFDTDTKEVGELYGDLAYGDNTTHGDIFQYTGYLSDAATLSVLYGRLNRTNPTIYPDKSDNAAISGAALQNPAYWVGGNPIVNDQTELYYDADNPKSSSNSLRADLSYQLGDHLIEAGIDNVSYWAKNQSFHSSGPGYTWIYGQGTAGKDISPALGVGAPDSDYYVRRYIIDFRSTMSAKQKGYYLQDTWQATDNLMVKYGLRNDRFTNYNDKGQAFVDQRNQWEPRVGVSWDVNGDSSLKIYGNLGRYYLALPQAVAERSATASTYTNEYFNYGGIDSNGNPTNLVCVPTPGGVTGVDCAGAVSANAEVGQPKDPRTVVATDLKAQFQDEIIFGFDKTLGENWAFGGNAVYRYLNRTIDDTCDMGAIAEKMASMGFDPSDYQVGDVTNPGDLGPGCRIFNPGKTNTFVVNAIEPGERPIEVQMTMEDWGIDRGPKRQYYGVNLYLEHPFDGKWYGKVDYTFSRSWGNAEGQVRSDIGQTDSSATEDWDFAELMEGGYGYLANHRRHQLQARGAYQITPEWLVSGTLRVQSGTPNSCLGYYGPDGDGDPTGYGSDYHWCFGEIAPPGGSKYGFTPWTKQLNLGVRYTPNFADQKLAVSLDIFNVTNDQKSIQSYPFSMSGIGKVNNLYGQGLFFQTPRYVSLSVSYDY